MIYHRLVKTHIIAVLIGDRDNLLTRNRSLHRIPASLLILLAEDRSRIYPPRLSLVNHGPRSRGFRLA